MGSLLASLPSLRCLYYTTNVTQVIDNTVGRYTDDVEIDEAGSPTAASEFPGYREAASKITGIYLVSQAEWLSRLLLPHFSSPLKTLAMGDDVWLDGDNPLSRLSSQTPNLQELLLGHPLASSSDLEQACKTWGSSLRILAVRSIEEISEWVASIMPYMTALTEVELGSGCTCTSRDIEGIARSTSPLRHIKILDIESQEDGTADDATNTALADLITAHSSRLEHLELDYIGIGPSLLRSCRKAKRLKSLDFRLSYTPSAHEIDSLLEECPELCDIPDRLKRFSLRKEEWGERIAANIERIRLEDTAVEGLGSHDDN
ncbi:hypothetical protein ACLX1H_004736 [Fusarium chlamydosporum]